MKQVTFRLKPKELLKERIEQYCSEASIAAGCVVSGVGSLEKTVLRMADAVAGYDPKKSWDEPVEIVSITGTVSKSGCHVHLSVSDKNGHVFGGHLTNGCVVNMTAEIVLLVFDDVEYKRELDPETKFNELTVQKLCK